MPEELWQRIGESSGRRNTRQIENRPGWFGSFGTWLTTFVRIPAVPVAAAALATLLVVILYPRPDTVPTLGLSSVSWHTRADDLVPKDLSAGRNRVAVMMFFKGFNSMSPDKIDSFYEKLKPPDETAHRLEMISPDQIRNALGPTETGFHKKKQMLGVLRDKLVLSRVVVLTLSSEGSRISVAGELVDTGTGKVLRRFTEADVSPENLAPVLRHGVYNMILRGD